MKQILFSYTGVIAAFLTIVIFTSYLNNQPLDAEPTVQLIKPVAIGDTFDFAGERLPMKNFDVRERLDRELLVNTYWHSSTLLSLKKQSKYFAIIEPILSRYGIPDDFKYLSVAESNLSNANSPAGAKGFWQLMTPTAKAYGLDISLGIDERFNLEKATEAACQYLIHYKEKFGSWTMAAAAYNLGATKMTSEIRNQKTNNYYEMNLNEETSRYIFRLVAIKEILTNPEKFGFYLTSEDIYPPLEPYHIDTVQNSIPSLADYAKSKGITYRMLKVYNPWLLDSRLDNPSGKTYLIKLPLNN
jgi:membrane-bound lytic murein transglycosylase D